MSTEEQEHKPAEPVVEPAPEVVAEPATDTVTKEAPQNKGFYSFFNKVDTFLTSTASQIQSSLPEDTSYLNKAVKKNLFVLNQKLNDFTNSNTDFEKSKLPKAYLKLEQQCDCIEKVLKKLLVVTETYGIEGYDYPPNLSDGFSDLLSFRKSQTNADGTDASQQASKHADENEDSSKSSKFLPRSFAQALSNSFKDSHTQVLSIAQKNAEGHVDEDEEEETIKDLIKVFDALKDSHYEMDEQKQNMDKLMSDVFNKGLKDLISTELHTIHKARKQVESSRLDLDALRYSLLDKAVSEQDPVLKEKTQLEDIFVTNTTEAVSIMSEFVDSIELLKLLKLFNELQLDYHKKCVASLEASLKVFDSLDLDVEAEE